MVMKFVSNLTNVDEKNVCKLYKEKYEIIVKQNLHFNPMNFSNFTSIAIETRKFSIMFHKVFGLYSIVQIC